ncbi:GntR family transcriptional regulator [Mycolicibacterium litorale]|uniref:GntR family transcriptional regulator n=1 Tax=Mycolicibacterium litorale TaxID=758802 RepID=UPI003CF28DF8
MASRPEAGYQTIARELKVRIQRGEFEDGRRLPTEAQLAEQYGVSRQTIRRAFQDLVADDLVVRTPRRGTFAHSPRRDGYVRQVGSVDDLMGLSEDTQMEILTPLARRVDMIAADRLRLSSDVVYYIEFARLHDHVRFCVTKVFLPPNVGKALLGVQELAATGTQSNFTIIGLIDRQLGLPIGQARQSITAEGARSAEAERLGCEVNHSLLRIDRLYMDDGAEPVELAISHFLPEQYSYRISLRRNG